MVDGHNSLERINTILPLPQQQVRSMPNLGKSSPFVLFGMALISSTLIATLIPEAFSWMATPTVLQTVITVLVAIVSLIIPLIYTVITVIGSQYESPRLPRIFLMDPSVRAFVPYSILILLSTVFLQALQTPSAIFSAWVLVNFGFILVWLCLNLRSMNKFADPEFLLRQFRPNLQKISEESNQQNRWVEAMDTFADIVVFHAKHGRDFLVTSELHYVTGLSDQLLQLKKTSPDKFKQFCVSNEYERSLTQFQDFPSQLQKTYSQSQHFAAITSILRLFRRLYRLGRVNQLPDITRQSIFQLIVLTKKFLSNPELETIGSLCLFEVISIADESLEHDDIAGFTVACDWFSELALQPNDLDQRIIGFLEGHVSRLFYGVIASDKESFFKILIDGLFIQAAGVSWPTHSFEKFKNSLEKIAMEQCKSFGLSDQLDWINKQGQGIYESEDLLKCWDLLSFISTVIEADYSAEQTLDIREQLEKLKREIKQVYIGNSLIRLFCELGAYCVYHKKFQFLKIFWSVQHQRNTSWQWLGRNLIPENLSELVRMMIASEYFMQIKYGNWGQPAQANESLAAYTVLLICKLWQEESASFTPESIELPATPVRGALRLESALNSISHSLDVITLKADTLKMLHLDPKRVQVMLDQDIPILLSYLRRQSRTWASENEKSAPVSWRRIKEFRSDFAMGFSLGRFRYFLNRADRLKYVAVTDSFTLNNALLEKHTYCSTFNRSEFIEDAWCSTERGDNWGRFFSFFEDVSILEAILPLCTPIDVAMLEHLGISKNWIVLTDETGLQALESYSAYRKCSEGVRTTLGLVGFLQCGADAIPVITLIADRGEGLLSLQKESFLIGGRIIALDCSNIGPLIQYPPSDTKYNADSEPVLIEITDLRKEPQRIEQLLSEEGSSILGSPEEGREKLGNSVLVTFQERFEFVPKTTNFPGYFVQL